MKLAIYIKVMALYEILQDRSIYGFSFLLRVPCIIVFIVYDLKSSFLILNHERSRSGLSTIFSPSAYIYAYCTYRCDRRVKITIDGRQIVLTLKEVI